MNPSVSVALCADRNVISSLHVTVRSLVSNTSAYVDITIVHLGWSGRDIQLLHRTLIEFCSRCALRFVDLLESPLLSRVSDKLNSLHGSHITWVRLLLPELLPDKNRVIYLDSDLIVCADLQDLWSMDLHGSLLAACEGGMVEQALDGSLLIRHGLDPHAPYFNAGVLVIDLAGWRKLRLTEKMLSFAASASPLPSHDQTALNYYFTGAYATFSKHYNTPLYAHNPPPGIAEQLGSAGYIYHFVGSPKPWDLLGRFFHRSFQFYITALAKTAAYRNSLAQASLMHELVRFWAIRRSYLRVLSLRLRVCLSKIS